MSGVKRVIEEMRDSDDRRVVGRIVSASSKSGRIPCKKSQKVSLGREARAQETEFTSAFACVSASASEG